MAWGGTNLRGGSSSKTAGTTQAMTIANATITAGEIAFLHVTSDNIATSSGSSANHSSVADSQGNVWAKAVEYTRSSGVAGDGVTVSQWYCTVTTALTVSADTITVTFSTSLTARCMAAWATSIGGSMSVSVIGTNGATGSSTTPSVTLGSLASASYYWVGTVGIEGLSSETTTADADYGTPEVIRGTSGGTDETNVRMYATRRANYTATTDTYNPTLSGSRDWAVVLVAYEEVSAGSTNKNDSDTFTMTETQSGTSGGGGGATSVSWAGGGVWGLGFQNCIGVHNDDSILLGADVAGFHFSEDDGQNVVQSNNGFTGVTDRNMAAILPDHTDADTWYALGNNAVWKTTDRADTWSKLSSAIDQQPSAAVPNLNMGRPRSTGNLLLWGSTAPSGNRWMYACSWNSGVWRSSNNGVTWTRIWGSNNSNIYLRGMGVVSQGSVDDLYVGAFETGANTGGLYHIDNAGGTSVTPQATLMTTPFASVEEVSTVVPNSTTRRVYVVGFSGTNASRSHGVWFAQNPGNGSTASWTRGPTAQLSTGSPWAAIDAQEVGAAGDRIAIGCFQPRANSGSFEEVFISQDGGFNWTCITLVASKVFHNDVGGPGGPSWPIAATSNDIGNASHELSGPSQIKWNTDGTRLYLSRYAGAWKCELPLVASGRNWYPMVNALGVTINGDIAADPSDPSVAAMPNVDRGMFITSDSGQTFAARGTGFNASRAVWWDTSSHLYVFGGDRGDNGNVDGDAIYFADPVNSASYTSLESSTGQLLSALTGGKRAYGGVGRSISGTVNILVFVTGHGICRYRWDGVGTPNDGTWATVKGNPPMSNASPSNKLASSDWVHDDICILYDPTSGVWRGKTGASINGSTVMTSWVLMYSSTTGQTGQGFVKQDPNNKERVFLSSGAGLFRLDNVFTAADSTEVTVTTITKPTAQPAGPIDIDSLGRLWLQSRPSGAINAPGYHRTSQRGAVSPSWTDLTDSYSDRAGQFATQMAVASDGTVYVAMDGFGVMIGSNSSETEVTISDSDSATMTDNETVSTSAFEDVSDNDAFTFSETETYGGAAGGGTFRGLIALLLDGEDLGDNNISDSDSFTLSETQSHDGSAAVVDPPVVPPPLPPIRHVIRSANGTANPPAGDATWEENAPGGYGPATARVPLLDVQTAPHLYQTGATWQIYAGSELAWEGILLDPIVDGQTARLVGRGWGQMADREVQRILYLSRDYSDWVPGDADPHDFPMSESWDATAEGGRLSFIGRKGEEVADGRQASLVFFADGSRVTSIAGTVTWNGNGGTNQDLEVRIGKFNGSISQAGVDVDISDGNEFDRATDGVDDDLAQIRIVRASGQEGVHEFGTTVKVGVKDLRVRGAADSDEMTSADVVLDIFNRLGIEATDVTDVGDDAMPLDFKGGPLGDVLDHCSLLTGLPWMILSTGASRLGTFREPQTWTTYVADGETTLIPVQRYNRVTVRYKVPNGRTRQVVAEPSDIDVADPFETSGAVFNYLLDVDQAHPTADKMEALAQRLLAELIVPRYTGNLARAWVEDASGALRYAGAVHAGDRIRVADGLGERSVVVTVTAKQGTPNGIRFTLSDKVPELDRYEARRGI